MSSENLIRLELLEYSCRIEAGEAGLSCPPALPQDGSNFPGNGDGRGFSGGQRAVGEDGDLAVKVSASVGFDSEMSGHASNLSRFGKRINLDLVADGAERSLCEVDEPILGLFAGNVLNNETERQYIQAPGVNSTPNSAG